MRRFLASIGLLLAAALTTPAPAAPPAFRAGFADRDISPAVGMEQPGGYGKAYHRAFHDACKVRAAVFDDGARKVAIVGIDSLFIRKPTVEAVRAAVKARCGIAPEAVLISASHTHSGGPIGYFLPGELAGAGDLVKHLIADETVIANPEYLAKAQQGIIDAIVAADAALVPARCGVGFGHEDRVSFNRRFHMKNGQSWTHPGQGNPEIVRAAGPIDPQVGVIGAWKVDDGAFLGCIVNFACHATTGPGGISADYIHYIEKAVRGLMGEDAVVVFLPGAGGDVTQVDNRSPYQIKQFGEVSSRFVGGRVGAEAVKALLAMEQGAGTMGPLAARQAILPIPRRKPSSEHLARAKELVQKDKKGADITEWTFAKETVVLEARIQDEPVVPVEVQAVQVGPAVFLACPAEYFCQFGLDMKAASRFPFTFPVSMANDCVGYVPTEEALGPGGGGYETRLTGYSNLEPKAGRTMANAMIELANGLVPGAVPQPAKLPPFTGKPWAYGNVPPQVD
jgi:hypothetical protein